jgi:acetyl-CoA carboxylase carboxyl transferase subunit beta
VPEGGVEDGARSRVHDRVHDQVHDQARGVETWDAVTRSRRPDRPGVRRLLKTAAADVVPLNGTGQGERDPALIIALARFGDAPCVLLAQDRREQAQQAFGPQALREAQRGLRLAEDLGLPVLTVIDTRGAALSPEAENGGLAGEIARCIDALVRVKAPTLCLMLGEGNGGGALAFLPADRVVATQHAWLSPLPPEGASAIVHGDVSHAADMARAQSVLALDLAERGIVDRIIPELPDAADEPEEFCHRVGGVIEAELAALMATGPGSPEARAARYA